MDFDLWTDVLAPIGRGINSVGHAIDKGVTTAIDVVGKVEDLVVQSPVTSAVTVVAAVATGGLALAAAPAIGAAVSAAGFGVAGGTLTGAAASSAGLAALGGGSLAAGGAGMLGGTIVATTSAGLVGGATGLGSAKLLKADEI